MNMGPSVEHLLISLPLISRDLSCGCPDVDVSPCQPSFLSVLPWFIRSLSSFLKSVPCLASARFP